MAGDAGEELVAPSDRLEDGPGESMGPPTRWTVMDRWLQPPTATMPEASAPVHATDALIGDVLAQLSVPTPQALLLGADARCTPVNGVNQYGFPPSRPEQLVQLSSCTLTIPDGVAIAAVNRYRESALDLARHDTIAAAEWLRRQVVEGLAHVLGLPAEVADESILCPSGTEAEFLPVAVALNAHGRPVRNIFVGAREAGRGVPVAGAGRWPVARTALGLAVDPGGEVPGFGSDLVTVIDVDIRDARGRGRRAFDVEAEVEAHVEAGLADGCTVIVHAMEGSKTGLRYLSPGWARTWHARAPQHVRVLVDAAQGRIEPRRVHDYLQAGATVLLTGSKAWCGPPFSAVLIPGRPMQDDLTACDALPGGLSAVFSRADLSPRARALRAGLVPANVGLMLRWLVALDEVRRHRDIPQQERDALQAAVTGCLVNALHRYDDFHLAPSLQHDPTIVTFAVRTGAGTYATLAQLTDLHKRAADAGVYLGQPVDIAPEAPPVLRAALGVATLTRLSGRSVSSGIDPLVTELVDRLALETRAVTA